MRQNKKGNSFDDYDFDFSKKTQSGNVRKKSDRSSSNYNIRPTATQSRKSAANKKRRPVQKKYRIPKKERMPAPVIILYIAIALLILAVCAAVFFIAFNKEKNKQNESGSVPNSTAAADSSVTSSADSKALAVSTMSTSSEAASNESSGIGGGSSEVTSSAPEENSNTESSEPEEISDDTGDSVTNVTFYDGSFDPAFFENDLFIGDSIYTGLYLYGFIDMENVAAAVGYTPYKAMYEAFDDGGLSAVDYAAARDPKRIIIMLGSNCLASGADFYAFVDSYGELLSALRANCPDSVICVVSVPPVTSDSSAAANADISNENIRNVNSMLLQCCENEGVDFFDLYQILSDENGCFKEEYAEADGLHFLGDTYKVMLSGLENLYK